MKEEEEGTIRWVWDEEGARAGTCWTATAGAMTGTGTDERVSEVIEGRIGPEMRTKGGGTISLGLISSLKPDDQVGY